MISKIQWIGLLLLVLTTEVWAQVSCDTEYVSFTDHAIKVAPTGLDDTENLQCALDHAAAKGFPFVKLGMAEYFISSVTSSEYMGTLSGTTIASTTVNVINDSINCQAMLDRKRAPSALKFSGGDTRVQNMTIKTDTPCTDHSIGLYVLHFTGAADRATACERDVVFGTVDRVVIQGTEVYNPLSSAVAVLPEGSYFGGCQDTLLGTFKINRSEMSGYTHGVITVLHAGAQVDINFNQFARNRFDVLIPNANLSATVTRNNFTGIATNESDYIGIQVLTNSLDAPDANRVVIHKNTFDIDAPGPGNGSAIVLSQTAKIARLSTIASENIFNLAGIAAFGVVGGGVSGSIVNGNQFAGSASAGILANPADSSGSSNWAILANLGFNKLDAGSADIVLGPELSNSIVGAKQTFDVQDFGIENTVLPVGPDVELTARVKALEVMVASLTAQLGSHEANASVHHERYADAEAIAASGPHFSGSHADLSDISADQHHVKYTDAEAVAGVGPHFSGSHADLIDVSVDQHHVKYTDDEAVAGVGPHFSGTHDDLTGVTPGQHHADVLGGVTRGIDPNTAQDTLTFTDMNVQIVNGSGTTSGATTGTGNLIIGYNELRTFMDDVNDRTGSHMLVIGENNNYTANSFGGMVVGLRNGTSAQYSTVSGGLGNQADGNYTSVAGGQSNLATGEHSAINGGRNNLAIGNASAISGGDSKAALGDACVVGDSGSDC